MTPEQFLRHIGDHYNADNLNPLNRRRGYGLKAARREYAAYKAYHAATTEVQRVEIAGAAGLTTGWRGVRLAAADRDAGRPMIVVEELEEAK